MEILRQLGLDQTVWIQLGFFLVSYIFLSQFLFKPYVKILKYRQKNTGGALDEATQLATVTERLAMDYQGKMKKQNEHAEEIYRRFKAEGGAEEDKLVGEARARAAKLLDETKKKISDEMNQSKEQFRAQIPQISGLIASRLLGRAV